MIRRLSPYWHPVPVFAAICMVVLGAGCSGRQYQLPDQTVKPMMVGNSIVLQDGRQLGLRRWPEADAIETDDDGPVLLALHGFNDYSRAFEWAAPAISEKDITVYAYDQSGFGADPQAGIWPGRDLLVSDLRAVIDLIADIHPGRPLYILGESMGAAVTILAAADQATAQMIDGIVLVAPAVWGWSEMNFFYRASLWLSRWIAPGWQLTGEGLGRVPTDNIDALRQMARDPFIIKETRVASIYGLVDLMDAALKVAPELRTDVLVLYGAKDEIVPCHPVDRLIGRLNSVTEVRYYPEGYHMLLRDLGRDKAIGDIVSFVTDGSGSGSQESREDSQEMICHKLNATE